MMIKIFKTMVKIFKNAVGKSIRTIVLQIIWIYNTKLKPCVVKYI